MASQYLLLPNERTDSFRRRNRRQVVGSILGVLGGLMASSGTRLPLATLPGLGAVNLFDYQAVRAPVCLGVGVALTCLFLVRLFRLSLLGTGVLGGLLTATGLDLQRSLRELTANARPETADLAGKVLHATRPESGALLLIAGCLLCVLASFIGLPTRRGRDRARG